MSDETDVAYLYDQIAEIFQTSWRNAAKCADAEDKEVFFDSDRSNEASEFCRDCPVKFKCLDHAVANSETYYHYYLSEKERYSLQLHRRRHLASFRYDVGLL